MLIFILGATVSYLFFKCDIEIFSQVNEGIIADVTYFP